jgi:hypothetical protein
MRKQTAYIETSVWGAVVNDEPIFFRNAALKLLGRSDEYNFYISPIVNKEINRAAPALREQIERLINETKPILLSETTEVAEAYIKREVFSERYREDAMHVAFASCHHIDFLVSYNFKHMVRVTRRDIIRAANTVLGYHTPIIVSAEELAEESWEE